MTHMPLNVIYAATEAPEGSDNLQQLLIALLCTFIVGAAWFIIRPIIPQRIIPYILLTTTSLTALSLLLLMVYS